MPRPNVLEAACHPHLPPPPPQPESATPQAQGVLGGWKLRSTGQPPNGLPGSRLYLIKSYDSAQKGGVPRPLEAVLAASAPRFQRPSGGGGHCGLRRYGRASLFVSREWFLLHGATIIGGCGEQWWEAAMAAMACLRPHCRISCVPLALFLSATPPQRQKKKKKNTGQKLRRNVTNGSLRRAAPLRSEPHSELFSQLQRVGTMTQSQEEGLWCRGITFSLGEVSFRSLRAPFPPPSPPPTPPHKHS